MALQMGAKPAALEVAVQSQPLQIPRIPASVSEARSGYRKTQREIQVTMAEMEQDATTLCLESTPDEPRFLAGLQIPEEACPEARMLVGMLSDEAVDQARNEVNGCWMDWTMDLLRIGLSDPDGRILTSNWEAGIPYVPRFVCPIRFIHNDGTYCRVQFQDTHETWDLKLEGMGAHSGVARVPYRKHSPLAKAALRVSEFYAPTLQGHWDTLREEMDASALEWLEIERGLQPTRNPDLVALRRLVKFQFLERYRSALWFCYIIWAHMASQALPPPLGRPE